jgi:hypothetical protein
MGTFWNRDLLKPGGLERAEAAQKPSIKDRVSKLEETVELLKVKLTSKS